ncbi:unnamed protein product [Polarella glacialis]|uniref:Methyltransferase domain-containing protein n=1 Tax=Polarella glacialis TaxID=89957 RepID=A0A813GWC4_POLGL|nr:unnamed protein product [Polarella glacialis]
MEQPAAERTVADWASFRPEHIPSKGCKLHEFFDETLLALETGAATANNNDDNNDNNDNNDDNNNSNNDNNNNDNNDNNTNNNEDNNNNDNNTNDNNNSSDGSPPSCCAVAGTATTINNDNQPGQQHQQQQQQHLKILELGCGTGELAAVLEARGHCLLGVDVNSGAVAVAAARCPGGRFFAADVADESLFPEAAAAAEDGEVLGCFDFAVLQLLLSLVGGRARRLATLRNAAALLRPGGALYLSVSGASDEINASYAELYARDRQATGEERTYFSREEGTGKVLYSTHHFLRDEIESLLLEAGLSEAMQIQVRQEASSRRPLEAANFIYATARKPELPG